MINTIGQGQGRMTRVVLACAILSVSVLFLAERCRAISGTEWQRLSIKARTFYVAGVIEGWQLELRFADIDKTRHSKEFSTSEKMMELVVSCATKRSMEIVQLEAIVKKYVDEHPNEWDDSMPFIALKAMSQACEDR